ncbi:oligomeric, coiled-coil, peripheral membrane protein [Malassezia caprae]|uniref:Autophagy-related protein 11 n=1 Tax=Malassezia caprae TaxID=1381934 RepID=A0AAF0EBJ6_9BASI|nr:oligomeric, coiled-coil, peripheral membrane protein [Malassezia caprae]
MNKEGVQITADVLEQISLQRPNEEEELYVFDRELLVADTDTVAPMLEVRIDPTPMFPANFLEEPLRVRALDWVMGWVTEARASLDMRMEEATELDTGLHLINQSTYVALQNLEIHAKSVKTAVSNLETIATKDFSSMQDLLSRYEWDLAVLERIPVHPQFQRADDAREGHGSTSPRTSTTLASFVKPAETRELAQSCEKDMQALQGTYSTTMKRELQLSLDLHDIASEVKRTDLRPSENLFNSIRSRYTQAVALAESIRQQCLPPSDHRSMADTLPSEVRVRLNQLCSDFSALEAEMVHSVEELAADRNELQCRHLNLVQDIGSLQSDFAELSSSVAEIDTALQSPPLSRFEHLQRLKRMCWAYGATLIEAVRRREFTSRFLEQAKDVAELMAHVSDLEIARRKTYAADIAPLLPWDSLSLELMPPVLDITTRRRDQTELAASFTRSDIDDFFEQLGYIDVELPHSDGLCLAADLRESLAPLLHTLDDGEAEFHRTARKQLGLSELSDDTSDDGDSLPSDTPSSHSAGPTDESSRVEQLESQLHAAQERIKRLESELTARTGAWRAQPDAAWHAWTSKAHELAMHLQGTGRGARDRVVQHSSTAGPDALDPVLLDEVRQKLDQLSAQCQHWEQAYKSREHRAGNPAKLSVASFEVGSLALFLPTKQCDASAPVWSAFHIGAPHHFLRMDDTLARQVSKRDWLVARIVRLTRHVAAPGNIYGLSPDTPYALMDIDGWQDPTALVLPPRPVPSTSPRASTPSSPSPSMLSRWPWRQAFFTPMHIVSDRSPRPMELATASTSGTTSTTAMAKFSQPRSPPQL